MHSSLSVTIIFLLIDLVLGGDNRIIIGSSVGGVLGLVLLILDLIAIFELLSSSGRGVCSKLIWILIIVFFPIGGLIFYWCCGRRRTVDQIV